MYERILVPVDLGHREVAAHIVRVARWLAGEQGEVTLLHVMDRPPAYAVASIPSDILESHRTETRQALDELAAAAAGGVTRVLLAEGNAAAAILDQAGKDGVDAIVLGSHRPDYRDYLIGSTAARVVRHAACTVIVERSWTAA